MTQSFRCALQVPWFASANHVPQLSYSLYNTAPAEHMVLVHLKRIPSRVVLECCVTVSWRRHSNGSIPGSNARFIEGLIDFVDCKPSKGMCLRHSADMHETTLRASLGSERRAD